MYEKKGFTFIELIITIALISMMGAIGGVSYKGFDKFQNHRYAEKELQIIEDAYLYTCTNTDKDIKTLTTADVNYLLPQELADKFNITYDNLGYNIIYYKNGSSYSLRGGLIETPGTPAKSPMEIVMELTEDVRINMENLLNDAADGVLEDGTQMKYLDNDKLREYLLKKVYHGFWPTLPEEFCRLNGITGGPYYIQPMSYPKKKPPISEVLVYASPVKENGKWNANFFCLDNYWYKIENKWGTATTITATNTPDEIRKLLKLGTGNKYIPLK